MKKHKDIRPEEVKEDYNLLMNDYVAPASGGFSNEWKLVGDFYEQYSLYDYSQQSISSNQLSVQ